MSKKATVFLWIITVVLILLLVSFIIVFDPFALRDADASATEVTTTAPLSVATESSQNTPNDEYWHDLSVQENVIPLTEISAEKTYTEDNDGLTAYDANLSIDIDGDGADEQVTISFVNDVLQINVEDNRAITSHIIEASRARFTRDASGNSMLRGDIRAYSIDLNPTDVYLEIAVELSSSAYGELQTVFLRYTQGDIIEQMEYGAISGRLDQTHIQMQCYDQFYQVHLLYRNYEVAEDSILIANSDYFTNTIMEMTITTSSTEIPCLNEQGESIAIPGFSSLRWHSTDMETKLVLYDLETGDYYVLPITKTVSTVDGEEVTTYLIASQPIADLYWVLNS